MILPIRIILALIFLGALNQGLGQTAGIHQFTGLSRLPDGAVEISLTGSVASAFRNYFDLFPVGVSSNLTSWQPLVTLLRTNKSTNALTYTDPGAVNLDQRFYRTPTNQLITAIPPPDGPYRVGVFARLLTDSSRTNRYNIKTNSSFMVSVWYPAQPVAGVLPGSYVDPKVAALGPQYCFTGNYGNTRAHALPGAPLATNESKYPLVIYSHGHQLTRSDNTRKVENLASYGFIVLALDHINCYATVFPDGTLYRGMDAPNLGPGDPTTMLIAINRAADIRYVLDEVARWNTGDPMLKNRLDLDHVGIFGHSFGGGTSAAACAQEARIRAGLSLDGGGPSLPIPVFDRPFLILSGGDNDPFMEQFRIAFRNLFYQQTRDAYWVHLKDSNHCDFNDTPWFDSPSSTTLIRRALVQDRYIASFFRKYLRGQDDHFLDAPPADWPEVDEYLKK